MYLAARSHARTHTHSSLVRLRVRACVRGRSPAWPPACGLCLRGRRASASKSPPVLVGCGGSLLGRMQEMRVYKFKDNYLTEHNFTTYSRNPPQPHTHSSTIIPSYDQHENGARASTRLCTNALLHVLEAHDLTTYLRPTNWYTLYRRPDRPMSCPFEYR